MYQRFLVFCIAVFCYGRVAAQSLSQNLDSLMRAYAAHKGFNGSVLVAKGAEVLVAKGYGYKNVAAKTTADDKTLYQYGSVTKQFTAALILKLQEEGRLNISDKLSKYFPQFSFADSVTLHHLLTHTSGIFNYTADAKFMSSEAVKPTTQARIFELIEKRPLAFTPGSKFSYSNSNYMLLGYITEKITGQPYETLVRQYIVEPAGMHTAGFDFTRLQSADKATGYNGINGNQAFPAGIVDSTVAYAAGALYGSVYDLYAWHKVMQTKKLLSPQSWQQMYTPVKSNYALGVIVDSLWGKRRISHGGGIFGFLSDFVRYPDDAVVIVVLTNNGSKPVGDISKNLSALVFGQAFAWPQSKQEAVVPAAVLETYAGEYQLAPNFSITITVEDAKLMAQATGQTKHQIFAQSETRFFYKVVDAQIEFKKDAEGKALSLTLFQNGMEIVGKKIK